MVLYEELIIMNIFFDLDGTLIDSRQRLYFLFQSLVKESVFSFDEYWVHKRNKKSHREILSEMLHYSVVQISDFEEKWMARIEEPEWLSLDKPFDGISEFLKELKQNNSLFVVTARQSELKALEQLEQLGWSEIFDKIFVTGQKLEKYEMIQGSVKLTPADWFVGDTGKDIQTGKKLGIRTAAVLSGFLSHESLLPYEPDLIRDNVLALTFN